MTIVAGVDRVAEVVTSCDHLGMLKFSKSMPYVLTEHGAILATNVLASPGAVEMVTSGASRSSRRVRRSSGLRQQARLDPEALWCRDHRYGRQ